MDSTLTASDVALLNRDGGYGWGDNGFMWIFALLILAGGGFGFGGNNRGNVATTEDLASGFNFQALQNKGNETLAAIQNTNQNISNAVCQLGYNNLEQTNMLGSKIDACCCNTQRAVDSVKFDMANYAAATNAHVTEQTQKVLDAISANKIETLQAQVNQLQLQQAFCGVPKINPYGYGIYPTMTACGCGCTNI